MRWPLEFFVPQRATFRTVGELVRTPFQVYGIFAICKSFQIAGFAIEEKRLYLIFRNSRATSCV